MIDHDDHDDNDDDDDEGATSISVKSWFNA